MEIVQEPEYRIKALREIAKQYEDTGAQMIIQYIVGGFFECASVRPCNIVASGLEKTQQGSPTGSDNLHQGCYVRWLALPETPEETERQKKRCEDILRTGEAIVYIQRNRGFPWWTTAFGMHGTQIPITLFGLQSNAEYDLMTLERKPLHYIAGSLKLATLYVVGGKPETTNSAIPPSFLAKALRAGVVEKEACRRAVIGSMRHSQTLISLRALSTVEKLFQSMPGFTTPIKVANAGLWKGKWIPKARQDLTTGESDFRLSLRETFACVIMFESGGFNLDPEQLHEVMAISSGNSLFVPKVLLRDPCEGTDCSDVVRITGNLGRPGMSLLIPPKSPRSLHLGDDCWVHINHDVFNGNRENCFPNSTLHLSFTGFEMPVDIGEHGLIDTHISFLEASVSLHNRGTWIADLDILRSLRSMRLGRVEDCDVSSEEEASFENFSSELIAVDSWEELLESPDNAGIVRAHTNWQARLAAMALGIQRGHKVLILNERTCWKCIDTTLKKFVVEDSDSLSMFRPFELIRSKETRQEDSFKRSVLPLLIG